MLLLPIWHDQLMTRHSGFSILEVMIAISVLAVAILTVMSGVRFNHQVRNGSQDQLRLALVIRNLSDRFTGSRTQDLNTNRTPWSYQRVFVAATPNTGGITAEDLVNWGVMPRDGSVDNLRIFVEYYRARAQRDSQGNPMSNSTGIFDQTNGTATLTQNVRTTNAEWNNWFDANNDGQADATAVAARLNLADGTSITNGLIGPDEPIVVRIYIRWSATRSGGALRTEEIWLSIMTPP